MELSAQQNPGLEARPYCGPPIAPEDLPGSWNLDPWLLAGLFGICIGMLWHRSRSERSASLDRAYGIALAGLFVAFVSPLCAATVSLFSARALHHLILLCVVAPALAVAVPVRAVPAAIGMGLASVALILWHLPPVYASAWNSVPVYWLMQGALLVPAWLLWSAILRPDQRAESLFGNALLIGGYGGVMGMIGAVLTFATSPLYPQHLVGAEAFGTRLIADQQLAGLIMWVPGFLPLAAIACWMLRRGWKQGFAA